MIGIVVDHADTVATVVESVHAGAGVTLTSGRLVRATTPVPACHKIALVDHDVGDLVIKYGAPIAVAFRPITCGEHVHVHNVATIRARRERS